MTNSIQQSNLISHLCMHSCIHASFILLSDATFTHENVSTVLASVPTRNLSSVLWIPESRLKQIQTLSPSETDERINVINYFPKCSVLAEWGSLAGLLYFFQHLVPLAAAKNFITRARGIPCMHDAVITYSDYKNYTYMVEY